MGLSISGPICIRAYLYQGLSISGPIYIMTYQFVIYRVFYCCRFGYFPYISPENAGPEQGNG